MLEGEFLCFANFLGEPCFETDVQWEQAWDAGRLLVVVLQEAISFFVHLRWRGADLFRVLYRVLRTYPEDVFGPVFGSFGLLYCSEKHRMVLGLVIAMHVRCAEEWFSQHPGIARFDESVASCSLSFAGLALHRLHF